MAFSKTVARVIAKRVNNLCSNPNCNAQTTGPHSEDEKSMSIGKAAHIAGEKPSAARYDASMSRKERQSANNGIWLCGTCHDKVDKDENRYPTGLLRDWKRTAEARADVKIATKQGDKHDLVRAIQSALQEVTVGLKHLDERIELSPTISTEGMDIALIPKETITCTLRVGKQHEGLLSRYVEGEDVEIPEYSIEGSELLAELSKNSSLMLKHTEVEGPPIVVRDGDGKIFTIGSRMVQTAKALRIKYCGAGVPILGNIVLYAANPNKAKSNLEINIDKWEGTLLHEIPFLEEMAQLLRAVRDRTLVLEILLPGERAYARHCNPEGFGHLEDNIKWLETLVTAKEVQQQLPSDMRCQLNIKNEDAKWIFVARHLLRNEAIKVGVEEIDMTVLGGDPYALPGGENLRPGSLISLNSEYDDGDVVFPALGGSIPLPAHKQSWYALRWEETEGQNHSVAIRVFSSESPQTAGFFPIDRED